MPKHTSDTTGPKDNPLNIAIREESIEEQSALETAIAIAKKRLKETITASLDEIRRCDPLGFEIFMKRRYEQEMTKDKRPKAKSFRKISQELGLVGRETDPRHAERQARLSYDNTCALLRSSLRDFQEEYSDLKRRLRELIPD
jgi:hypothetical protein